jgi:hypothetical protein
MASVIRRPDAKTRDLYRYSKPTRMATSSGDADATARGSISRTALVAPLNRMLAARDTSDRYKILERFWAVARIDRTLHSAVLTRLAHKARAFYLASRPLHRKAITAIRSKKEVHSRSKCRFGRSATINGRNGCDHNYRSAR